MTATAIFEFFAGSYPELLELGVLLCFSAFFSGSETALFVLNRAELRDLSQSGGWAGKLVVRLMKKPDRVLNTLLLANMIVNVAFASISAMLLLKLQTVRAFPGWVVVAGSLCPLAMVIFFGEVTPKMLAYSIAKKFAMFVALPIFCLELVLWPLIWVMEVFLVKPSTRLLLPSGHVPETISPNDLAAMMDISEHRGTIDSDAGEMLREIMWLSHKKVRDVMIPRVDMIQFDVNGPEKELEMLFRRTHLRKMPVYDASQDNTLGAIRAREFLLRQPGTPIREFITPIVYIPENAKLTQAMDIFRKNNVQLAIVVDEYGGTAGLVTIEDILEVIVGDIPDRHELPVQAIVKKSDTEYIVSGELPVYDWPAAFGIKPFDKRISTVGGLVMMLLGRLPHVEESVEFGNIRLTVKEMDSNRVEKVQMDVLGDREAVK